MLRDLSHELDYMTWLFGPCRRVAALGGRFGPLAIDSDERRPGTGERMDIALAALLAVLAAALFVYLSYTVISRI